jgi:hypothetical protein
VTQPQPFLRLSYLVIPCHTLSYLVIPCRTSSYFVIPCRPLSSLVIPHPARMHSSKVSTRSCKTTTTSFCHGRKPCNKTETT